MEDIIVVGCGFAGAVAARKLAEEKKKRVVILEKRSHIGGNMYDSEDINGILVHWYGPHIFHTESKRIFEYLRRFTEWVRYEHKVMGNIRGQLVPIPFNYSSLEDLFPEDNASDLKCRLSRTFPNKTRISILELLKSDDAEVKRFGRAVYDMVFVNYTAKQWGVPPEKIDSSVINRVPVVLGYDNKYFQDPIQYMPTNGFTRLFDNMISHPNINVEVNCDASKRIRLDRKRGRVYFDGKVWDRPIVYTGALDELMEYEFGALPYRSLDLVFERYKMNYYQLAAVVNYPNEEKFTRITEFKHFTCERASTETTILKEYPMDYDITAPKGNIPYYPIINEENLILYAKYRDALRRFGNIYPCGRLAEYRYYNMDAVVDRALSLCESLGIK
ncbi:dTDP-fucopyranose mutase [Peptococcaceae bacterium CEB3]|nr:dTDP-fucopyranose mutase [Peptococcaceae bacterium CEB3]